MHLGYGYKTPVRYDVLMTSCKHPKDEGAMCGTGCVHKRGVIWVVGFD